MDRLLSSRLWYGLAALVVAGHFFTVWHLADTYPKYDDLNDIFGFFGQLQQAQDTPNALMAFFFPNNEHITATNHVLYWLQWQLTHTLDLHGLIIIGHMIILLTAWTMARLLPVPSNHAAFWLCVVLLTYLNLHSWQGSFMVMTALSNQSVLLFALLSLYGLHKQQFALAILCAALASFSQGNGLLVWPVGLLFLLNKTPKPMLRMLMWMVAAVCCGYWYLAMKQHFPLPDQPPAYAAALLARLQAMPWMPATSTLVFLGSIAWPEGHTTLAIATSVICFALLCVCYQKPVPSYSLTPFATAEHPLTQRTALPTATQRHIVFYVVLFLLLSAITASGLRGLVAGHADVMMASRYRMYSLLLLLATLGACSTRLPATRQPWLAGIALCLAMWCQTSGWRFIPAIQAQTAQFRESYAAWLINGDFRHSQVYFAPLSDYYLFSAHYLSSHGQLGEYNLLSLASPPQTVLRPIATANSTPCPIDTSTPQHCTITLTHRGNAIAMPLSVRSSQTLTSPRLLVCAAGASNSTATITLPDWPANDSAPRLLPEASIPPGDYTVWLQDTNGTQCNTTLHKKPRKVDVQMGEQFKLLGW